MVFVWNYEQIRLTSRDFVNPDDLRFRARRRLEAWHTTV